MYGAQLRVREYFCTVGYWWLKLAKPANISADCRRTNTYVVWTQASEGSGRAGVEVVAGGVGAGRGGGGREMG